MYEELIIDYLPFPDSQHLRLNRVSLDIETKKKGRLKNVVHSN
jgi:hypothetical protein